MLQALSCDLRIGVGHGRNHTGDACRSQRVATRPGAALVGAGLKGHPGGRALHAVTALRCIAQSHDFGMRPTRPLGVSFAQERAIWLGNHAAHARVGRGQPQRLVCQLQCPLQGVWVSRRSHLEGHEVS